MNKYISIAKRIFILALVFVSTVLLFACSSSSTNSSNTSNSSSTSHKLGAYYYLDFDDYFIFHLTNDSQYDPIPYAQTGNIQGVSYAILNDYGTTLMKVSSCREIVIDNDVYFDSDKSYSASRLFSEFYNVQKISGIKKIHIKGSADLLFANCPCSELNIKDLDTSEITSMDYMFGGCENLKKLNIEKWDIRKVISMYNMFEDCPAPRPSWYHE